METRILVAYGLMALLAAAVTIIAWVAVSRRTRRRRRDERMRDRGLGRRRPLSGDSH